MMFNALKKLKDNIGMGTQDRIIPEWLEKINKDGNKILEVGFGKGELLLKLKGINNKLELSGVEASENNYYTAEKNVKNCNLNLMDLSTERLQYPDNYFDVVIIYDVLEHLMNPLYAMLEIKRVLKIGGLIIFSYPEERLISGIGLNENQNNRKYEVNYHSFPFPGMFNYEYLRVFLNQLYFKIVDERTNFIEPYHVFLLLENFPEKINILEAVNIIAGGKHCYDDIVTKPLYNLSEGWNKQ